MNPESTKLVIGVCADGRITYVSDIAAGARAAQKPESAWIGQYVWDTVPEGQRARVRQAFAEALLTGVRQVFECETDHGGISERWRTRCDRVHSAISVILQAEKLLVFDDRELTRRERQILQLMASDWTVEEIADELKTRESTITTHQANIRRKLGCSTNAGAAVWAVRAGL